MQDVVEFVIGVSSDLKLELPCSTGRVIKWIEWLCYKVMQAFMVTGLFAGQHNTKLPGKITGVIYTIVGSAFIVITFYYTRQSCCSLDLDCALR